MHFLCSRADGRRQDAAGYWCSAQGKFSALEKHQLGLEHCASLNFLLDGGLPPLCPTDKAALCPCHVPCSRLITSAIWDCSGCSVT